MALSEWANGFNGRTKFIYGAFGDPFTISVTHHLLWWWASFGHQATRDGSYGHLLITRWAGSKSQQNEPPFSKLWIEVWITWTGEHLFLCPFQMEDTIFLFNYELVADTCTQNSHSGCRHSQLLILLQVSSSSGFGSDSDHLLPKQSLCFHTLATGNCWFLSRVPNAGASPVPGPPCFSRAHTACAREPVIRGFTTIIINRCSDVVTCKLSIMFIS